jgi:hypothetical protein
VRVRLGAVPPLLGLALMTACGGGGGASTSSKAGSQSSSGGSTTTSSPAPMRVVAKSTDDATQINLLFQNLNVALASGNQVDLEYVFADSGATHWRDTGWGKTFVDLVTSAQGSRTTATQFPGGSYREVVSGSVLQHDDSDPSLSKLVVSYHTEDWLTTSHNASNNTHTVQPDNKAIVLIQRSPSTPQDQIVYVGNLTPQQLTTLQQQPSLLAQYTLAFVGQ